jgi:FKBP-type peptidyl-prolyl cis-trans isomerase
MSKRHVVAVLIAFSTLAVAGAVAQGATPATPGKPQQPRARPAAPPPVPPAKPTPTELAAPPASAAKLPSGVATMKLRAGKGEDSPRVQDVIVFRAIGRRADGTVVQDSFATPEPARTVLSRLNRGWQEGMIGMKVGEQRRFWFPASLMPMDKATGVKEPVVFDVELVQIGRMPSPPASLKTPDARAVKAGLGTSVLTVRKGKEDQKATRTDGALVNFTLWNPAGQVLLSSAFDGRPTLFPIDKVMPAFADCLVGMGIGEQRLCWIPALHNDGFPGALKGDLVFELELLNFIDMAKLTGNTTLPDGTKPAGKPPGS